MAAKKKTTSTGSPTLDAANAAKKFKAPKGYKPLTTAQKVTMAASATPVGRVAKVAVTAAKAAKATKVASAAQKAAYKAKVTTPAKKVVAAAKAEAKANARGLKAANKPVKNKDASVMNRNNQYARQAILNEKPARSTATRGGGMKSKQNWPEGMKKPKPSLADPKVAEAKRKADAAARLKRIDYNSRNGIF